MDKKGWEGMKNVSKRVFVCALSLGMLLSVAPVSAIRANAEGPKNLALGCTAIASDAESVNPASKAVDGDMTTRWATNQHKVANEWIEVQLKSVTDINKITVNWEDRSKNNGGELILQKWKAEVKQLDGTWKEVFIDNDETTSDVTKTINLTTPVRGTAVRVTALQAKNTGWQNVAINEIVVNGTETSDTVEQTENKNHMLTATSVTASTTEVASLGAENIKDGKNGKPHRWASAAHTYKDQWIEASLAKLTKVSEIKFVLFERDVDPSPSNIKSFDLKYTDSANKEQTVHIDNVKVEGKKGYGTVIDYKFNAPVYMSKFKLENFGVEVTDASTSGYNNISIDEVEIYSNVQGGETPQGEATLDSVVASIHGAEIASDVTEYTLPTVPEGFTIESNGADFEQIVGKAKENGKLPVIHPLEDKTVKISFNVTDTKTNQTKNTGDLDFVVKGKHTPAEGKNAKPVVIPEIQEWHSDSTDHVAVSALTKVTYDNAALKPIVDEFVSDYKDFTGVTLTAKQGNEEANAFNFHYAAPDALLGNEGYTMDIKNDRINVASAAITGNMYGMQTILQMFQENGEHYPVGQMRDYPRYQTRGLLLDVARKPVSLEMMKEFTRTMRYYKMNDFQAHLSDNYIFLENYGAHENEDKAWNAYDAFRLESSLTNEKGESPTAADYSISKADFKDFIHEERAVGMNIVPEIDVPAHAVSFTKVWPELAVHNATGLNKNRPLIDHFDLTKPESIAKIKEIFDDYTKGNDPTFDDKTTVHIGADEFVYNAKSYRDFFNTIVPYVKQTNPVRLWGGLSWIKDNPLTQIIPEAVENVEMNLWSSDWADGMDMYNMGFKLINTIDNFGYMVPNGNLGRANAYGDLLNVNRVFNEFAPEKVRTKAGYKPVPSGDDQMLGAAYAIWSDNIDKHASGLTESDLYWRFFDALPFYAEKTWAATGKEKGTAAHLAELAQDKGTGPNTNPYYQEDKKGDFYEKYDFANEKDTSENKRDLKNKTNADINNGKLTLKGGASYVETPIEQLGNGNELSFDFETSKPLTDGQILFEEDAPYGTHDIRVMNNGKLGFTRELYNYYFNYTLPVGEKVNVKIVVEQQSAKLYINDVFVSDAVGEFVYKNEVKKNNIKAATFALPLQRIGSKTNAVSASIDNVVVKAHSATVVDKFNKKNWTATTNSETKYDANEGLLKYAFDNKPITRWHSNWQNAQDKVESINGTKGNKDKIWADIDLHGTYNINSFSFTPRVDKADSGQVTRASLYIKNTKDGKWKEVAKDQKFAADTTTKTFYFDKQDVAEIAFIATQSNDGWVTVSEFDLGDGPRLENVVYVEADAKMGTVTGAGKYAPGAEAVLTAKAKKGYRFVGWYRGEERVSEANPYTFAVNDNVALTAKFEKSGTTEPTAKPTAEPTVKPTAEPTAEPTVKPTAEPTAEPTAKPTVEPTAGPTDKPTAEPTAEPEKPGESVEDMVKVIVTANGKATPKTVKASTMMKDVFEPVEVKANQVLKGWFTEPDGKGTKIDPEKTVSTYIRARAKDMPTLNIYAYVVDEANDNRPATGDTRSAMPWAFVLAGAAIAGIVLKKRG